MQNKILSFIASALLTLSATDSEANDEYGMNLTKNLHGSALSWQTFSNQSNKLGIEHGFKNSSLTLNAGLFTNITPSQIEIDTMLLVGSELKLSNDLDLTTKFGLFRKDIPYFGFGFQKHLHNYSLAYQAGGSLGLLTRQGIQYRILQELSLEIYTVKFGGFTQVKNDKLEKYWLYFLIPVTSQWSIGAILNNNTPMLFCKLL